MKDLKYYRKHITKIDKKILRLLKNRDEIVLDIGNYKKLNHMNIIDKKREKEMFLSLKENSDINDIEYIKKLYKIIINHSRTIQKK
jgi:chorismate mutase